MRNAFLLFLISALVGACQSQPKEQAFNGPMANDLTPVEQLANPDQNQGDCPDYVSVGFYNLENLFDIVDDPAISDEEFLPESKKNWTGERYQTKLENLAKVLATLGKDDKDQDAVDVFGVCEVENKQVVEDLLATGDLQQRNFQLIHYDSPDTRGIDVAFAYDPKLFTPTFQHAYEVDFGKIEIKDFRRVLTRSFLVVTGTFCGEPMGFIVNHWPSRRGGVEFSSPKREYVAKQVRRVVDSLEASDPDLKLVLMGDFNDTPFDKSIQQILDADTTEGASLFNTVAYLQAKGIGSHYYHEERSMLDQLIINRPMTGEKGYRYEGYSANRFAPEWLKQDKSNGKYAGFPNRTYAGDRYFGGYSDHFPVYLHLKRYE